ncbi:hypothetical protein BCR33DRAFT_716569 [Rhizoclosmatium globosum]|uniref:Uncharacterized protein n=1 Tax=Rhizoclosmatium globosum TaxID=329046 RepID=A0A1Y2CEP8_9FUNG|nr:hypothetical protein BCR33DRAFT_716569 [Rhizoclosmatium globosum]|eukprot:ORY45284.1 hypothetical protein BCR33DRAFT_716569 [Rhizoclosmatium globosum]
MNGNDFLVTSWYQNGSCAPSNLFAYSFVPFPSCATAKPSDQLDGTCKQDYDFLGQLSKNLGGQTYILFQSFANDVKCSDPAKTTEFYALTFNKNLNLNLNVEDWSPNNRQLSRDESNINKIYLTRDGSVIKTFDAKHLLLLRYWILRVRLPRCSQ